MNSDHFSANAIGVDLGTANTLIYVKGEGIVLNRTVRVAIDRETKKIKGVGLEAEAHASAARTRRRDARAPMKDGVIADFDRHEKSCGIFITLNHREPRVQG